MNSDTTGTVHQGKIVAEYRRRRKWSRATLARVIGVDESTVYRMEQMSVIKNPTRRKLLVGILGIPVELLGLEAEQHTYTIPFLFNEDRIAFFEEPRGPLVGLAFGCKKLKLSHKRLKEVSGINVHIPLCA